MNSGAERETSGYESESNKISVVLSANDSSETLNQLYVEQVESIDSDINGSGAQESLDNDGFQLEFDDTVLLNATISENLNNLGDNVVLELFSHESMINLKDTRFIAEVDLSNELVLESHSGKPFVSLEETVILSKENPNTSSTLKSSSCRSLVGLNSTEVLLEENLSDTLVLESPSCKSCVSLEDTVILSKKNSNKSSTLDGNKG